MLEALSSSVRQDILLQLARASSKGLRISEIRMKRCITRPTLSHHFKILLKANIIKYNKEGTKNYYYLSIKPRMIDDCIELLEELKKISANGVKNETN